MHNTSTEYKQMHNKTISWNDNWILIFIWLVGTLLEPSASTTSFLIQMLRWIRGSSWVESFIFLIAWGSSLNRESLIFSCSHLLFFYYESSFFFLCPEFAESNHSILAHIPQMNESHDPGRPFKVAITTSALFTSSFTASICTLIWETLVCIMDLHILQLVC